MFIAQLEIDSKFMRRRQNLYVVNKRPQIELFALLAIRIPIANQQL
jgi:hypothetical protein